MKQYLAAYTLKACDWYGNRYEQKGFVTFEARNPEMAKSLAPGNLIGFKKDHFGASITIDQLFEVKKIDLEQIVF